MTNLIDTLPSSHGRAMPDFDGQFVGQAYGVRRYKVKTGQVIPLTDRRTGDTFWYAVKCVDEAATWVWDGSTWITREEWVSKMTPSPSRRAAFLEKKRRLAKQGIRFK